MVFDLDRTASEKESYLDSEMSALLTELLSITKVAVAFGGNWPLFEKRLVSNLPHGANPKDLSLLPSCGTKCCKTPGPVDIFTFWTIELASLGSEAVAFSTR